LNVYFIKIIIIYEYVGYNVTAVQEKAMGCGVSSRDCVSRIKTERETPWPESTREKLPTERPPLVGEVNDNFHG
jgi:hypothetical protein